MFWLIYESYVKLKYFESHYRTFTNQINFSKSINILVQALEQQLNLPFAK